MKLSKRAIEILEFVDSRCFPDGRYFVPMPDDPVYGAGDASCLLSLERKGLIKKANQNDYNYKITDVGKKELEGKE